MKKKESKKKFTNQMIHNEKAYSDLTLQDQQSITDAVRRGITRREFVSWLTMAGITVSSAGSILATATDVLAAKPKQGGMIRYGSFSHGPADTMDPVISTTNIDSARHRAHYNGLVQFDENLMPTPELAQEFSSNFSATEWTFKIRKDVVFHDGSKLTADDVIWSMRRHMGKDSKSKAAKMMSGVKEWKKVDPYTVKAVFNSPDVDFPTVLGIQQFKIVKKDTTDWRNPPGTGPFLLEEFRPGVRSIHVRNPNYWREGPNLDRIEMLGITDSISRVNALLANDVQIIDRVDPKAVRQLEAAPGVYVESLPSGAYGSICCMKNSAPGNNDDFVMALKLLQNRERIVKFILKGHGTIGNDQPINSIYPDHCDSLPQRQFDPDKAKFHLKRSGITEAEIHVAPLGMSVDEIALMTQNEASKIGLKLNLKRVPTDGYWSAIWMKTPIHLVTWNPRFPANAMLSMTFAPDAAWNDSRWKNQRVGDLISAARSEMDAKKRREMYCEIETAIHNESGVIIPAHSNYIDAARDNVKGIPKIPTRSVGGGEWPEFVWMG